ncbi:protein FAM13A-like isoform X4 [Apostichopus japonicus]|uniref:protein FAM13A-like isoform X4 n=1 Tax=Stichopus japonicus TaxID=307972 RepID=UPI003AB6D13D
MQKILRSPASIRRKATKGTFGIPLTELIRSQNGQLMVPHIVEKIVQHLQANGLNQEGIFRINGSTKAVDKMKSKFDKSQDADLSEAGDIMAVAGLLKLFLRELPDPLMTEALHEQFISLQRNFMHQSDSPDYLPQLKNLLTQLPEENYLVLKYLCRFLVQVTDSEKDNKMNSRSLSIVFGPNLFRCSDGVAGLQEQAYTNMTVRAMIEDYDTLFNRGKEQNGQSVVPLPDNSKQIMVKPAVQKRSPPVKPVSYEQYLKDRLGKAFAKRDAEERDVNSNSLEKKDKEDGRLGFDRQDAMSPCDISSADERALSPFNLDSDSTVPSPIVSDSAIEVVDRAIKECISQHLFGSPEKNAPVPTPRTKRLQKKEKEAAMNSYQSQGISHKPGDSPSKNVVDRVRQYSFDSVDSLSPPTTPLPKNAPDSSAFKFFETHGMVLSSSKGNRVLPAKHETKKGDKDLNNTNGPSSRRKHDGFHDEDNEDDVFDGEDEADDLHQVERSSPVYDKVPEVRTPPPRTHRNGKKGKRSVEQTGDGVPTQLTELDLDSVQRDSPVLQKLTEGRVYPPKTRARSRSRERSESGDIFESSTGSGPSVLTNGSLQHSSHDHHPQGKHKISPHKALAEAAMATRLKKQFGTDGAPQGGVEEGGRGHKGKEKRHDTANDNPPKSKNDHTKDKSQHDLAGSPKKKGKKKTRLYSKEANDLRVRDVDSPEVGVVESKHGKKKTRLADTGLEKSKSGPSNDREDDRSRSTSPKVSRPSQEEDNEDHLVPSLDLSSLHANAESDEPIPAWTLHQRADWLNNMEELTIDVKAGPVDKVSSSTADRTHEKPLDKTQNIKQLTRQVRNLKRKIRQYEEEYIEQHGHKPSTAEKAAEPEVKKMMRELKKAAKQLKAAKEQSEESNKPLHSTLPASMTGKKKQNIDESNSESSLVESLKDAMDLAEEWLKEKRKAAGRMDDIFEMSKSEVHDEKVSIQKVLLQLENKYGRPTTRETKEIMKPLYDRYRNLKRLIAKFEVRRTLAEEVVSSSPPNLNTIDEHEETKEFTPKQLGTIHTLYTEDDLEPCMVTQEIPSGVRGQYKSFDPEETLQSPVDLSGRADSPLSPDSSANFKNLADASLSELIKTQNQALSDKKRVRRLLKEFEDNFFKEKGRKVQKEDRGPMEDEYNEYKRVKKQLKLLDALMEKHQSQTNTGVT